LSWEVFETFARQNGPHLFCAVASSGMLRDSAPQFAALPNASKRIKLCIMRLVAGFGKVCLYENTDIFFALPMPDFD